MTEAISDKAVIQCPEGTVLFREGESGTTMFVVKSGRIQLSKTVHNTEVVVDELGAGAFCGELTLINDQPRPVTATVIKDASLIKVEGDQFAKMVQKNPDLALRMLKKMGQRLTEAQYRVSNLILRTTEGRVLHQLRQEAIRAGDTDSIRSKAPIPQNLADALALEVGEVRKLLNTFIEQDLIAIDEQGYFQIIDPASFERYLTYLELDDRFEFTRD